MSRTAGVLRLTPEHALSGLSVCEEISMTMQITGTTAQPRRLWRSTGAVLLGILAGAVLSVGTDQVLHVLEIYPPWGQAMREPGLNLLALAYRCVYDTLGFYLIARLAPRNPARHVWVGAAIGLVLSAAGVLAALEADLGPLWYPVALALSTLPSAWVAVALHRKRKEVGAKAPADLAHAGRRFQVRAQFRI
jgi:hypothetical protein